MVQMWGFLREGRIWNTWKGTENSPWKGTQHTLHRRLEGITRRKKNRIPFRDPNIICCTVLRRLRTGPEVMVAYLPGLPKVV